MPQRGAEMSAKALGGAEGLTANKLYGKYGPEGEPATVPKFEPRAGVPLAQWIEPAAGQPLTFRTQCVGKPGDVTLVPFYKLFGERYALYWEFIRPEK